MPTALTVIRATTISHPTAGTASFAVNDSVLPTSPFYYPLLWGGFTSDTGVMVPPVYRIPITFEEIALQRTRQDSDLRGKYGLLTSEVTAYSVATVPDGTLSKLIGFDTTTLGLASGGTMVLTQNVSPTAKALYDALPFDFGTPAFQKWVYQPSATKLGYVISSPSKNPDVLPAVPNQNAAAVQEVRFRTNAPKIQIFLDRILGATQDGHELFINGLRYSVRPQAGSSGIDYITLTFADSSTRDIAVRTHAAFGGVLVGPLYSVWKPEPRSTSGLSMYTIGDSYNAVVWNDAGSSPGLQGEVLACGIEDHLGIRDHYIDAVGGTGWTVTNNTFQGPNNTYVDRWPQVLRANPDVLFVPNGAANDAAAGGATWPGYGDTVVAAMRTCFASLRAQNSKTKFIYADGFAPPHTAFVNNLAHYAVLRAKMQAALADIGIYYIDTTTSPWLYGTGYSGHLTGDGNADLYVSTDQAHLSGLGYRYLRLRMANKVRRIMVDDGTLLNTVI